MEEDECVICGEPHPRCSAHARIRDEDGVAIPGQIRPCKRWPAHGTRVCGQHGAQLPQVRAAGKARKVQADAAAVLGFTMDGKVPDILAAMEGLAAMSIAMVEALAARVNALHDVRYSSEHSIEQIRAEVILLERSIDRSVKLLEVVAKHKPDGEAAAAVNLLTSLSDKIKDLPGSQE